MSSTFRSSYDESSTESVESFGDEASNTSAKDTHGSVDSIPRSSIQIQTPMALVRSGYHPQLPNIQPHQHSTLFYLSLIEGRCRTQAANALNAGRPADDRLPEDHPEVHSLSQHLFGEMTKELHRAGVLPDEFAGQELSEVRKSYLSSFDSILHNIAEKKKHEFQSTNSYSSLFDRSHAYELGRDLVANSIHNGKAFASQYFNIMAPGAMSLPQSLSELSLTMPNIWETQFKNPRRIGKGGFGSVYRVLHPLSGELYAVKKIVMKRKEFSEDLAKAFLEELRALAKLSHPNIVRYYYSWLESQSAEESDSSSDSESESEADHSSSITNAGPVNRRTYSPTGAMFADKKRKDLSMERGLANDARRVRRESRSMMDDIVSFEEDNALVGPIKTNYQGSSDSEPSDDEGVDLVLFIQMNLHPTNLESYLWPQPTKPNSDSQIVHCFHTIATARLLLGVLSGMEYIHRTGRVHRDLKPSNIMLSIRRDASALEDAFVRVDDCLDCQKQKAGNQELYLMPHIGDFGLVANIQDTDSPLSPPLSPNTALVPKASNGSFLSRQVGTRFYCGPKLAKGKSVICPKLDVYSFGVIAFEMIYKFGTRSERNDVLEKLTEGEFPKGFEKHAMAEGIKKMLCHDREGRWSCPEVRVWLQSFLPI